MTASKKYNWFGKICFNFSKAFLSDEIEHAQKVYVDQLELITQLKAANEGLYLQNIQLRAHLNERMN